MQLNPEQILLKQGSSLAYFDYILLLSHDQYPHFRSYLGNSKDNCLASNRNSTLNGLIQD